MTMKKIGHNKIIENMASTSIAFGMNDIKIKGHTYLVKEFFDYIEASKKAGNRSVTISTLVYQAYVWGQNYQLSLDNQEERSK